MNEHIDITFAGAKIAARNNEAVRTAIHGVSAFYNVGQMARYRTLYYQEQYARMTSGPSASAYLIEQYRREMWKHTALASLDIFSLFVIGLLGMSSDR